MADIEKVIKGLERCMTDMNLSDSMPCRSCPYGSLPKRENCQKRLFADAIVLLRVQEAKPPAVMEDIDGIWSTCSMCGHKLCRILAPILAMKIDTYFPKFCSECGQAVKWDA